MKPILFNTEMVRAILAGQKTVTRRVVKPCPVKKMSHVPDGTTYGYWMDTAGQPYRPPYLPGDILYVRETWCDPSGDGYPYLYKADMPMHWDAENTEIGIPVDLKAEDYKWRPSIHMPKEAARLFLRVTDVRAERLQDISEEQAEREGCFAGRTEIKSGPWGMDDDPDEWTATEHFADVWNSTIKPADRALYGWDANPLVWAIEFERCENPELVGGADSVP